MWTENPFPAPGQPLWDWLIALVQEVGPERPTVETAWWGHFVLPQVRPARLDDVPDQRPPGRGRPRRPIYDVTDAALAWDIENFRPDAENQWDSKSGVVGISSRALLVHASVRSITYRRDSWDSRTIRRWRDAGREVWAAWGAWPWALTDKGKLARTWWKRPEYAEALRDWAEGRVP